MLVCPKTFLFEGLLPKVLRSREEEVVRFMANMGGGRALRLDRLLRRKEVKTRIGMGNTVRAVHSVKVVTFVVLEGERKLIRYMCRRGVSGFSLGSIGRTSAMRMANILTRSTGTPGKVRVHLNRLGVLDRPTRPVPLPVTG